MVNSNVHDVVLPSNGCINESYPKVVKMSSLTVAAFKLYSTITKDNVLFVLKEIVQECCKDNIDVGALKDKDVEFLIMWLRINSAIPGSDHNYTYQRTCKNGHTSERTVNLSDIQVNQLADYSEPQKINLQSTGSTLELRLLSIDDEIEIGDRLLDNPKLKSSVNVLRAAFAINTRLPYEEKLKYINSLTSVEDLAAILDFLTVFSRWGFSFIDKTVKCDKCDNTGYTSDLFIEWVDEARLDNVYEWIENY